MRKASSPSGRAGSNVSGSKSRSGAATASSSSTVASGSAPGTANQTRAAKATPARRSPANSGKPQSPRGGPPQPTGALPATPRQQNVGLGTPRSRLRETGRLRTPHGEGAGSFQKGGRIPAATSFSVAAASQAVQVAAKAAAAEPAPAQLAARGGAEVVADQTCLLEEPLSPTCEPEGDASLTASSFRMASAGAGVADGDDDHCQAHSVFTPIDVCPEFLMHPEHGSEVTPYPTESPSAAQTGADTDVSASPGLAGPVDCDGGIATSIEELSATASDDVVARLAAAWETAVHCGLDSDAPLFDESGQGTSMELDVSGAEVLEVGSRFELAGIHSAESACLSSPGVPMSAGGSATLSPPVNPVLVEGSGCNFFAGPNAEKEDTLATTDATSLVPGTSELPRATLAMEPPTAFEPPEMAPPEIGRNSDEQEQMTTIQELQAENQRLRQQVEEQARRIEELVSAAVTLGGGASPRAPAVGAAGGASPRALLSPRGATGSRMAVVEVKPQVGYSSPCPHSPAAAVVGTRALPASVQIATPRTGVSRFISAAPTCTTTAVATASCVVPAQVVPSAGRAVGTVLGSQGEAAAPGAASAAPMSVIAAPSVPLAAHPGAAVMRGVSPSMAASRSGMAPGQARQVSPYYRPVGLPTTSAPTLLASSTAIGATASATSFAMKAQFPSPHPASFRPVGPDRPQVPVRVFMG